MIIPTIAERFNFKEKLMIWRLNPIGPVRFFVRIDNTGKKLEINLPNAEPSIAPTIMNVIKNPMFCLSKIMLVFKYIQFSPF